MYAQQNDSPEKPCGNMQSFEMGGYSIPANYRGNAFTLDEPPTDTCPAGCESAATEIEAAPPKCLSEAQRESECERSHSKQNGILSGILGRFSRGFELDDILLIGLIVLLLQNDCERRDETVILLALLLLGGF